jgi:hypothetical protein
VTDDLQCNEATLIIAAMATVEHTLPDIVRVASRVVLCGGSLC